MLGPPTLCKATRRLGPVSSRTDTRAGAGTLGVSPVVGSGPGSALLPHSRPQEPGRPGEQGAAAATLSLREPWSLPVGGEPAWMPPAGLAASSQPSAPLGTWAPPWPCLAPHTPGQRGTAAGTRELLELEFLELEQGCTKCTHVLGAGLGACSEMKSEEACHPSNVRSQGCRDSRSGAV